MKGKSINCISVIGTGMIGASLATLSTGNGYRTRMYAINPEEAEKGLQRYETNFRELIKEGLVTEKQYQSCRKLLTIVQSYKEIEDADLVFECVFEKLEVKHEVYRNIEKYCNKVRAIASSSSAFSVRDLADGLEQKDKLVVAHPWNPPHLVPCIELVRGECSSDETVCIVKETLEAMGRQVALLNVDVPGFIGNRIQHAIIREAVNIIERGIATAEDIDKALKYSFMPRYTSIGLFEHQDNAGLDLVDNIEQYLFPDLSTAQTTQKFIRKRVEAGELGIKTGKGVYDWTKRDVKDFYYRAQKPYFQFFNWNLPENK